MRGGSVALYRTNTYCTFSTLQSSQTLDPLTDMYMYTDLCLAHPLDS